jgi:NAD(P)-dependent dehydrogenase (short-subunit alcohol dehydrogenase family)
MADRLKGRVALVTGAGRGIGRCEAIALASEGARIVVNDMGGAADGTGTSNLPADDVVKEITALGGEAIANYESVSTWKAAESIVKSAVDSFGRLDILVNNAGIVRDRMIFNMTPEDWDAVIKVHLYGHFYLIRHACNIFRRQRFGRIINTSSVAGLGRSVGQANYAAAKEGIVGLTRMVARDMARLGVTCNAIRPNAGTRLTLSDELKEAWTQSGMQQAIKQMEQLRPEDVAPLVVWLASEESANVNGHVFQVQTGKVSLYSEPVEEKSITCSGPWTVDDVFERLPSITQDASLESAGGSPARKQARSVKKEEQ